MDACHLSYISKLKKKTLRNTSWNDIKLGTFDVKTLEKVIQSRFQKQKIEFLRRKEKNFLKVKFYV
jgi:hypothetical protein